MEGPVGSVCFLYFWFLQRNAQLVLSILFLVLIMECPVGTVIFFLVLIMECPVVGAVIFLVLVTECPVGTVFFFSGSYNGVSSWFSTAKTPASLKPSRMGRCCNRATMSFGQVWPAAGMRLTLSCAFLLSLLVIVCEI